MKRMTLAIMMIAFFGLQTIMAQDWILPYGMYTKQPWAAKYFYAENDAAGPADNWFEKDFDESSWGDIMGPIIKEGDLPFATPWEANNATYWVRRHFQLNDVKDEYFLYLYHDDECEVYLNGHLIYSQTDYLSATKVIKLSEEEIQHLTTGDNVFAVKTSDTGGGNAYIDFGLADNNDVGLYSIIPFCNIPITLENDPEYPWNVQDGTATSIIASERPTISTSSIKLNYESEKEPILTFYARNNYRWYYVLFLYIDNQFVKEVTPENGNSDWTFNLFNLPAGNHIVEFRDTIGEYNSYSCYSQLRNIAIWENTSDVISSILLEEGSLPMTFENNHENPWIFSGEAIESTSPKKENAYSDLTARFTIDKPCMLTWTERMDEDYYHYFNVYIDGTLYHSNSFKGTANRSVCLKAGEHEIVWQDWNGYGYGYKSYLSNVKLTDEFKENVEVTISDPGQLGYEALIEMGPEHYLRDVQFLTVHGAMNEKDWSELADMINLYGLDLSDASFEVVPDNAFKKMPHLSYLVLPEGVKTFGNQAFMNTQLLNLDVPSSVTSIGTECFKNVRIQHVNFKEDSQLEVIGFQAFYNCYSLLEFDMPNSVTSLVLYYNSNDYYNYEANTFRGCVRMKKIKFSDALTYVPLAACYDCTGLEEVILSKTTWNICPYAFTNATSLKDVKFNEGLFKIDHESFRNTPSLSTIELPESLRQLDYAVFTQSGLESVKLPGNRSLVKISI